MLCTRVCDTDMLLICFRQSGPADDGRRRPGGFKNAKKKNIFTPKKKKNKAKQSKVYVGRDGNRFVCVFARDAVDEDDGKFDGFCRSGYAITVTRTTGSVDGESVPDKNATRPISSIKTCRSNTSTVGYFPPKSLYGLNAIFSRKYSRRKHISYGPTDRVRPNTRSVRSRDLEAILYRTITSPGTGIMTGKISPRTKIVIN